MEKIDIIAMNGYLSVSCLLDLLQGTNVVYVPVGKDDRLYV
ncbi:unnamed protein product, partial [marine sediment metagenome]